MTFICSVFNAAILIPYNLYRFLSSLLSSRRDNNNNNNNNPILEDAAQQVKAYGWAARDSTGLLSPFKFLRRITGEHDVKLKILYCGICHSDLHLLKNDLGISTYPLVPGHEIVGVVTEVGSKVRKVKVGDNVGVGCMVGSCRKCDQCANNLENYCPQPIYTYNSKNADGTMTYGGYSDIMVADEHFIIRWPESLPLDSGAPLLCAGTTTYSAMKYYGLDKRGLHIGVVGLGGLGHIAVKFAKAFGSKVTVISSSPGKKKDAIEGLGADGFIVSSGDTEEIRAATGTMDGIIDTVAAIHPVKDLINMLKPHGKMVVVGVPEKMEVPVFPLVAGRKTLGGSLIGGIKETQEMIDFAAARKVTADVEIIPIEYVNQAMERLQRGDVKYRFVIDVATSLAQAKRSRLMGGETED